MNRALAGGLSGVLAAALAASIPSFTVAQIVPPLPQSTAPADKAAAHADVPVKAVVLFSSGVGYFEHFGTVTGDGTAELRFKTDQINDVLKSLVLQDLDKGSVGTVTYPSQEPLAKTLKSFQVDITNNTPLADLLNQLRGAKIELAVVTLGEPLTLRGTIVGVEKQQDRATVNGATGQPQAVEYWVLNLKVGRRFQSVNLSQVRDFALEDPKLDEELDKALSALAQARDQEKKPVTINFRGRGERRVRMGYVIETPIWKTSYRLVLTDAAAKHPVGPATREADRDEQAADDSGGKLQGWAIVENQTESDWNNVQLSLVSGRPISFIQDLYHPLYVPRPVVFPDLYASLRPQTYQGGITDEDQEKLNKQREEAQQQAEQGQNRGGQFGGGGRSRVGTGAGGGLFGGGAPDMNMDPPAQPLDPTASVASAASAAAVGELFEYTVGNVSLPRQRSAMIPIVADDLEADKLSIYNAAVLADHPLNGARIKNTTDKHLLQGPVTVLEAGRYAGDARIDDVPPGQSRLLSYGIDLNVKADSVETKSEESIQTARLVKGVLAFTVKSVSEQTYVFQNKAESGRTVIVEHPRRLGWTLLEPAATEEQTESLYRFRTRIGGGKTVRLPVRAEQVDSQSLALLTADSRLLEVYAKTDSIPEPIRKALGEAIRMKGEMIEIQRQIDARKAQVGEVSAEQSRIRENMKTVAQNSEYYNRLLRKLDEQETEVEKLQKESADFNAKLQQQRKALEDYLANLDLG